MKRTTLHTFLGIALLGIFASPEIYGQSAAASNSGGSKQDRLIQELLSEVHQLRIALQQAGVNAYRGQVLVERLRLQQGEVNRLSQELNKVRNEISDLKGAQVNTKARLDEAEKQWDKGVMPEAQVNEVRAAISELKGREESLSEREIQLSAELHRERANLADLNQRLDALEREMVMTNQTDSGKRTPKR